jgi:hypothetical protein
MTVDLAVLDACVLFPAALRDTLLRTAEACLYRPRWTDAILDEVRRNLVESGRISKGQAARLIDVMRGAFPSAMVAAYEHLIPFMTNHPKDRHVLAAAVASEAPAWASPRSSRT